jgi:hypothetical protein
MAFGRRRRKEKLFKRLVSLRVSAQATTHKSHVDKLGKDIYFLSRLRGALQDQVRAIQQGRAEHFENAKEDPKNLQKLRKENRLHYNERLDRYEQVINSLLQLVSAHVGMMRNAKVQHRNTLIILSTNRELSE